MSGDVRRVSIYADLAGRCVCVDVALPSGAAVAELMPAILDLVGVPEAVTARRWRLAPVGGPPLGESITLSANNIHDGDLLVLSAFDTPPPTVTPADPVHTVTAAAGSGAVTMPLRISVCLWAVGVGGAVLASGHGVDRVITAALLACVTAAAAVFVHRVGATPVFVVTLSVTAVVLAAVFGFLVVPAGPAPENVVLAGAAAATASVLLFRCTDHGAIPLSGLATLSAIATASMTGAALGPWSTTDAGALTVVLALAVLSAGPRVAVGLAGLSPAMATATDNAVPLLGPDRAMRGHQLLTGMALGSSSAVVLGAALMVNGPLNAAALGATGAVVLILRARFHVDPARVAALVVGGTLCATASLAAALSLLGWGAWLGAAAVVAGMLALCPLSEARMSPVARRGIDVLEYLALAAVVPLTCWVLDVYGFVRHASLP